MIILFHVIVGGPTKSFLSCKDHDDTWRLCNYYGTRLHDRAWLWKSYIQFLGWFSLLQK
uniref:Uncharacterized protein n=1 Tax=Anguilla anguilla TaxID=7936 RepID=A0A0E9S020_ANGAN